MSSSRETAPLQQTIVRIDAMCCGGEAKLARQLLAPLDDVVDVKISVTDRRAAIDHRASLPAAELVRVLNTKMLGASIAEAGGGAGSKGDAAFNWHEIFRACVTAGQIVLFGVALALRQAGGPRSGVPAAAAGSLVLSWPMFHAAWLAILRCSPNVEFLMTVAAAGALLLGRLLEAASVGAIVSIMDVVKLFALERFERQLRGAARTAPPPVDIPGGGTIPVSDIVAGTSYIARAGDAIPADGVVESGKGSVDESRLTGEAMPQARTLTTCTTRLCMISRRSA